MLWFDYVYLCIRLHCRGAVDAAAGAAAVTAVVTARVAAVAADNTVHEAADVTVAAVDALHVPADDVAVISPRSRGDSVANFRL